MNIPGFTADASFRSTARLSSARAQHAYNDTHSDQRVTAALPIFGGPTRGECMQDCVDSCSESGKSRSECNDSCLKSCFPRLPTYQCTNRDNSINHYACLGGVGVWEAACGAECALLAGVPVVGPALAAACAAGCGALAGNMKASCPPAVICV